MHIPAHFTSHRTSAATQRHPAATHFTFYYGRLAEYLSNLPANYRKIHISWRPTVVLEFLMFSCLLATFSLATCRSQPQTPASPQFIPKLRRLTHFIHEPSASRCSTICQLYSTGVFSQAFFFIDIWPHFAWYRPVPCQNQHRYHRHLFFFHRYRQRRLLVLPFSSRFCAIIAMELLCVRRLCKYSSFKAAPTSTF